MLRGSLTRVDCRKDKEVCVLCKRCNLQAATEKSAQLTVLAQPNLLKPL